MVGLPEIIAGEAAKSRRNAQDLIAAFDAATEKFGVSRESILQKCKSFEVPDLLVEYARLRDLTIMPRTRRSMVRRGRDIWVRQADPDPAAKSEIPSVRAWDCRGGLGFQPCCRARGIGRASRCWKKRRRFASSPFSTRSISTAKHSAEELSKNLSRHGIDVVLDRVDAKGRPIGDVLEAYVASHAADMLVMGAYGHSRLREFVLGGATKSLLSKPPLPILFSH